MTHITATHQMRRPWMVSGGRFITYQISGLVIYNLLRQAFEKSSLHWATVHSYTEAPIRDLERIIFKYAAFPLVDGCVVHVQSPFDANKLLDLDRPTITQALENLSTVDHHLLHRILLQEVDADDADSFLQICLFGQILIPKEGTP